MKTRILITVFFLTMMTLLYRREAGLRVSVRRLGISPDLLTITWVDYDQFMWIERGGKRIGAYALLVRRSEDRQSYELTSQVRMELGILNMQAPINIDVSVIMNPMFEMQTFQGLIKVLDEEITAQAFVEDLELYYRLRGPEILVTSGGIAAKMPLTQPMMIADAIRPVVAQTDQLKLGHHWETLASDPISGQFNTPVKVEVVARESIESDGEQVEAFRVKETAGEIVTTSWYTPEGVPLRTELGNGLVMIRAVRQEVEMKYPEMKAAINLTPIDQEALRAEASENVRPSGENLMPFLPKL